jgi:hypothetical protein
MAETRTRLWDPAEHWQSEEDAAAYLEAAAEEGDPDLMEAALDDVARARAAAGTAEARPEPDSVAGSYIREAPRGAKEGYQSHPDPAAEERGSGDGAESE